MKNGGENFRDTVSLNWGTCVHTYRTYKAGTICSEPNTCSFVQKPGCRFTRGQLQVSCLPSGSERMPVCQMTGLDDRRCRKLQKYTCQMKGLPVFERCSAGGSVIYSWQCVIYFGLQKYIIFWNYIFLYFKPLFAKNYIFSEKLWKIPFRKMWFFLMDQVLPPLPPSRKKLTFKKRKNNIWYLKMVF